MRKAEISFSIPTGWHDRHEKVEFASEYGLGIEVAAFASGPPVADIQARRRCQQDFGEALRAFDHPISYHGAFIDISLHSADSGVARIARERILEDLMTARSIGAQTVIFHTGFNPLIPVPAYEKEFYERHRTFWPAVAEDFPEFTICLENHWEHIPQVIAKLIDRINHPRVRACFDAAHALVYGKGDPGAWIEHLGDRIHHMHWNDNRGDFDSHLSLGDGNINWRQVLSMAADCPNLETVVLELAPLASVQKSIRYLQTIRSELFSRHQQGGESGLKRGTPNLEMAHEE